MLVITTVRVDARAVGITRGTSAGPALVSYAKGLAAAPDNLEETLPPEVTGDVVLVLRAGRLAGRARRPAVGHRAWERTGRELLATMSGAVDGRTVHDGCRMVRHLMTDRFCRMSCSLRAGRAAGCGWPTPHLQVSWLQTWGQPTGGSQKMAAAGVRWSTTAAL